MMYSILWLIHKLLEVLVGYKNNLSKKFETIYIVLLVWFFGGLLTYATFATVQYYESQHSNYLFKTTFNDKVTNLTQAISAIDKVFLATSSLLNIAPNLTNDDFSKLINKEMLINTGMLGVQWAPKISLNNLTNFEKEVRQSGVFDYRVHPQTKHAGNCFKQDLDSLFPVLLAQPSDVIGHKLGLQLSANCEIAQSMTQAIINHKITTSNFVSNQGELGLRLLQPIFNPAPDNSIRGFVVGIVMMNQLVDTLWGDIASSDNYQLAIYGNQEKQEQLYRSQWRNECLEECDQQAAYLKLKASIPFANQLWYIELTQRSIDSRDTVLPYVCAGLIMLLAFGLSCYLVMNINRVQWANKLVAERTESLRHQASHDKLTQLYNKQALTEILNQKTSHHTNPLFSLLFIDLDHFKKINDTMGHLIGDKLLQQVAKRLKLSARSHDDIFRFGGDEFVVILNNNIALPGVKKIAQRILNQLIEEYDIEGGRYKIGASIGVAIIDDLNTSCDEIIRNADIAMYEAKNGGRGQVVFYHDKMYQSIVSKLEIENSLSQALANNEMCLHLQPIFSDQQVLIGFEALSRWQHPLKGLVMPDSFISIAEENGVIHPLGAWVIESVCAKLAQWIHIYGASDCPYISINISPYQLEKPAVVAQVKAALIKYRLPKNLLAIELTESALIGNKPVVKAHLDQLRALGLRIFLDDFGTGFSSLSLLQHFPIDVLKIDRSFVIGINENNMESKNLVKAIISMASALNMDIIAEGVEDQETLTWLSEMGCTSMQGYYFSKPLNQEDLSKFLAKHLTGRPSAQWLYQWQGNQDVGAGDELPPILS